MKTKKLSKGQSIPLELTLITITSIVLVTGSLSVFDTILNDYQSEINDYHKQKALTETSTSLYHLSSLKQNSSSINYKTPNRQNDNEEYLVTTSNENIIIEHDQDISKYKPEIAQKTEGDSKSMSTSITKFGKIMVISGQ